NSMNISGDKIGDDETAVGRREAHANAAIAGKITARFIVRLPIARSIDQHAEIADRLAVAVDNPALDRPPVTEHYEVVCAVELQISVAFVAEAVLQEVEPNVSRQAVEDEFTSRVGPPGCLGKPTWHDDARAG